MAEMKNSGTVWLGMIPKGWKLSKISSIYELRTTKVSDKDYAPLSVTMQGIVPQLETAAKTNAHDDRKLVKKGDFAINSRSDRRGSCGVSEYDGSVSLINTVMKPRDEMNPDYYNWLFHTTQFADEFFKWGHGIVADLWTTNWQDMKHIDIPVPSLEEQKRIADYLNKLIPEIDVLHSDIEKQIETLEEYKKAVIVETVTKGLKTDVETKDSGIEWIGMIPKDWSIKHIKYVMYELNNRSLDGSGEKLSVLTNGGVVRSCDIQENNPSLSTEGYKKINAGEIVFNKYKAHLGVFYVSSYSGIVTYNYNVYKCFDGYNPKYYEYLFKTNGSIGEFKKNLHGVGDSISPLYTKDLFSINTIVPPLQKQNEIVEYLNNKSTEIDGAITEKKHQLEILEEYKKSQIYEYVTGKKEVSVNEF